MRSICVVLRSSVRRSTIIEDNWL